MSTEPPGQDIPGSLLLDPDVNDDPYPLYRRLRREAPVWRVPGTAVVAVTSFDAVAETVKRVDDFSSVVKNLVYRDDDGLPQQLPMPDVGVEALASSDPPVHTVHRKTVFPELVAKKMAGLEDDVRDLSRRRIDEFVTAGGGEFMSRVANVIPISVIGRLIGFRDPDHDQLLQAAFDSTTMVGGTASLEQLGELVERTLAVATWIEDQVTAGGVDDDTLISTVRRGIEDGDLSPHQGTIILHTLLSAGGESTTSLIGNAVRILAEDPSLQSELRDEPELVADFVEEVLRLESPFRQQMRSVPTDTELLGVEIPAGSTVMVFFSAANRDPREFDDPDELRLDRDHLKTHLAFGRGIHFCVGAPLARLEARVVLTQLLDATEHIDLDARRPPRRAYSLLARRHEELPLVVR